MKDGYLPTALLMLALLHWYNVNLTHMPGLVSDRTRCFIHDVIYTLLVQVFVNLLIQLLQFIL